MSEEMICILDSIIWIGYGKFSLLGREYLSLEVNVLTKCPGISRITKRDIFQGSISRIDEEIS